MTQVNNFLRGIKIKYGLKIGLKSYFTIMKSFCAVQKGDTDVKCVFSPLKERFGDITKDQRKAYFI